MAMNMEAIVTQVIGLSGTVHQNGDLHQLHTFLKAQESYFASHTAQIPAAVAALDVSLHSLGVLYMLEAHSKAHGVLAHGDGALVDFTVRFLQLALQAHVHLEPAMFVRVARRLKDHFVGAGCPRRGILPLQAAARVLQPSTEHLTPLHADCFQLCLLSKVYNAAGPLLDDEVCSVDPAKTGLTPTDLLLYCYYGAMLAIGRKQYARALELLVQGLAMPTGVASAISVAMYKKYVMVSLIHTGAVAPLPKFAPSRVRSMVESECRPYTELAHAYSGVNGAERVRKALEQHGHTYAHDTNLGLAKLVSASLTSRSIQRLTQTYLTLAAADIAQQVGLPTAADAEAHILRMVRAGEIHAVIDQRAGMVRFLEDPEQYCTAATAARVDGHIRRCMALADKLALVQDKVVCDRQYVSKSVNRDRVGRLDLDDYGAGSALYQPQGGFGGL